MYTIETKRRYKTYKTHKGWVTAGIAFGGALVGTVFVSPVVHADETVDPTVDNSGIDQAVTDATNVGVEVSQDKTQTTVTNNEGVAGVKDEINKDYQQQITDINSAKEEQENKNNQFNADTSDANATNQANKDKVDQAVNDFTNAGGVVNNTTTTDHQATIDNYQDVKDKVNNLTNNVVDSVNNATVQQQAQNKVTDAVNDKNTLNQAVNAAKDKFGADNVTKGDDIVVTDVNKDNADDKVNAVKALYQKQHDSIMALIVAYDNALSIAGKVNNDALKQAVENAKTVLGADFVKEESTNITSVDMDKVAQAVNDKNADINAQIKYINDQVKQYQDAYAKYQEELKKYQDSLTGDEIDSSSIIQDFELNAEPDAKVEFTNNSNMVFIGQSDDLYSFDLKDPSHNITGNIVVNWTNLKHSSYRGKPITRIEATFSNITSDLTKHSHTNLTSERLSFYTDPTKAFWYNGISDIDVTYRYYDEDGNLINFQNNPETGAGAWITIGSLNAGAGRVEKVKLLSDGKVYGFKDSSVTVHDGDSLYSSGANEIQSIVGSNPLNEVHGEAKFPWGTENWDTGLTSPHAYYAAGVINFTGTDLKLKFSTERNYAIKDVNPNTWATVSTTIVRDNSGLTPPQKPVMKYHLNQVDVNKPNVVYHEQSYDNKPVTIDVNYNNLNVAKPDPTKVSYHYNEIRVTDPSKVDQNTDNVDINNTNVLAGSTNRYTLNLDLDAYKDLDYSEEQINKGFYYIDDIDDKAFDNITFNKDFAQTVDGKPVNGLRATEYQSLDQAPQDVKDVLKENNITVDGRFVVFTADDPQAFYNDYVKTGTNIALKFDAKLKDDFTGTYVNKGHQIVFGKAYPTNEVVNKVITHDPEKNVYNYVGDNINDGNVMTGDKQHYVIDLDLRDYKDYSLTKDQLAQGITVIDDYDETKLNVSDIDKAAFLVRDGNNKVVPDTLYDMVWDDSKGAWTFSIKDPDSFLKTYGGQVLKLNFYGTVKEDVDGDIYNDAILNMFGQELKTNQVVNHITKLDPKKDVVMSVDDNKSMDQTEVKLGTVFDYKLSSTDRPANYSGVTTQWSQTDILDIEHDQYMGQTKVYSKYQITMPDGSVVNPGDDITKYFDITYDSNTGRLVVEMNQELKDILNLDINKRTPQGFDTYVQVKRIKDGIVKNTAIESYNNSLAKTNTVTTYTPQEPDKVTPEAPEAPFRTPQTPVSVNTPATPQTVSNQTLQPAQVQQVAAKPNKQASLPQMGDAKDNTIALLGVTLVALSLGAGLLGRKKRETV